MALLPLNMSFKNIKEIETICGAEKELPRKKSS
jgi:hypothetical protein